MCCSCVQTNINKNNAVNDKTKSSKKQYKLNVNDKKPQTAYIHRPHIFI